ncbi:type II secretion system F family protein [Aliivibrio fischeri]|uniref:General secretion pathway protein F n=1 Tax=Aliivibrio fischeri SR5 TaxID=1088719 RepID=A0AAV3EW28_ALIFS|nr:type II secretion system F family protein [Aliivibrio fischeri]EHN71173.1 general secretion pathway protein F [Aliivibrio fischeri SR5]MUJ24879.1 type II secretion system F family protein [Aliivibrio fischeri]MUK26295.1 type II secretion system F family protein [Aliivibrio fischeri]MUK32486.1 type II secretion system F family protein [Aliivibrio fischeri]MUL11232.1 type II secretion system F family protein [Aliivibrio fischeri]
MAIFKYSGRNLRGESVSGSIEATSQESAAEQLMNDGVIPTGIKANKFGGTSRSMDWKKWLQPSIPLEVLVIFCRQMYSLTKAGVPLLRAMNGLAQNSNNKLLKTTLEEVTADLTNGRSLSVSMQQHPQVFSSLFVSMIHVGENTGRLDQSLMQLANYYEQEMETRKRIKSAMRYPVFVLTFILLAMFVLNIKVIPQFAGMFARFGVELPLPTRILIATSSFFVNYWHLLIGVMTGAMFAFQAWISRAEGREKWDKFRLRLPIVGGIVTRAQMSRFSRTFALMLKSGVPLNQSLALSAESLGNKYLENRLLEMKAGIESGTSMSATAAQSGIFTPLVQQMIAVGEETGQIDDLLLEVSDFYDREVDYDLKTLTARIEPILLVIVSGMVLILALGIFLPMWNMLDVVKGT